MVIKRKAKLSFLQRNKEESKFPSNENELGLEHIKSVKKYLSYSRSILMSPFNCSRFELHKILKHLTFDLSKHNVDREV